MWNVLVYIKSDSTLTYETRKNDTVLLSCKGAFEKGSLISLFELCDGSYLIVSSNHFDLRYDYQSESSRLLSEFFWPLKRNY